MMDERIQFLVDLGTVRAIEAQRRKVEDAIGARYPMGALLREMVTRYLATTAEDLIAEMSEKKMRPAP